jgi:phytoene dehydrogenase-like protein
MTNTDILIVGAGHNGLVTSAYLAKAGKSVLVLEQQDVPGGQLAARAWFGAGSDTQSLHPGGSLRPDIVRDLDLARHGLAADASTEPVYWSALPDGGTLRLTAGADDAATVESIRVLSARDAARWPEFVAFMNTAAGAHEP